MRVVPVRGVAKLLAHIPKMNAESPPMQLSTILPLYRSLTTHSSLRSSSPFSSKNAKKKHIPITSWSKMREPELVLTVTRSKAVLEVKVAVGLENTMRGEQ